MWPLIIGLILFLLYTYRDAIMQKIITLIRMLKQKVKGALFSAPKRAGIGGGDEGDYEDEVVELNASEVKEENRRDTFRLRQWKKDLKAWRTLPDGEEKYRVGYQLALTWLIWKKVPLIPADTPLEVLEKAKRVLSEENWAIVTDWYNRIRYAEPTPFPEQSLEPLEKALDGMEKAK